jgi:membrane carboxypeptidase/penicillin-binding protein
MERALDGHPSTRFRTPPEIIVVDLDPTSGLRATNRCPETIRGGFRKGTVPETMCPLH